MTHRVLLIIGGGIAAFKSLLLIRELARRGVETQVILTKGGTEFVTPLSAGALSGKTVYTDLWELDEQADMGHIELSRSADLIVVAPATANLMSRAAHGVADDLATTTLLATDTRVLYAPAMNVRMWEAAATQRNVKRLAEDGALFIGPDIGDMACGEHGPGRMAEPDAIADAVQGALMGDMSLDGLRGTKPLTGRHAVVTAGPTREAIDPVRYISNHSSGLQGYAIAQALADQGAQVTLVSGPTALPSPIGVTRIDVESARDMLAAVQDAIPADIFVSVAAVADWRPATQHDKKAPKPNSLGRHLMKRHFKSALFALALGATASNAYAAETSDCELLLVQIIQSHDGNGEAQVPSYVPAEEFMASLEDDKPGHMTEHLDHKIQAVMCRRNDILPRLEDYTILATGIPFILSQDFDSSDTDSLTLYWKDEAIQHIYKGYPLSEEAESVLETPHLKSNLLPKVKNDTNRSN